MPGTRLAPQLKEDLPHLEQRWLWHLVEAEVGGQGCDDGISGAGTDALSGCA